MRNFQWGTAFAVAAGVLIAGVAGGLIARVL
jgi:hypothetical protein